MLLQMEKFHFFMAEYILLCVYVCHPFSIHSSVNGCWAWFHSLVFVSNAFYNIGVHVLMTYWIRAFLYFGYIPRCGIAESYIDWFQIGKGVRQGCIFSPCLFSLYAEYIMRNAGLEESQAGIKIAGRNINNLRYADDTTLMAEMKRN